MPASIRSSETQKKFFSLILSLTIILIMFGVIVGLGILAGKPLYGTHAGNNAGDAGMSGSGNGHSLPAGGPMDEAMVEGAIRVSLLKAIDIATTEGDVASWSNAHAGWRLYRAQADHMDNMGLSEHWLIILRSTSSIMCVEVVNGQASSIRAEGTEPAEVYPADQSPLYDSHVIVGIVAESAAAANVSVSAPPFSLIYALEYSDLGTIGTYEVRYNGLPSDTPPFSVKLNARSGEIVDSHFSGPDEERSP